VKIPKGNEKEKSYGHCRDNGVAAIGKIIKVHAVKFNVQPIITFWLNFLPLRNDKDEGIVQHQLLVNFIFILDRNHAISTRPRSPGIESDKNAGSPLSVWRSTWK
jgi:hypothetical protein